MALPGSIEGAERGDPVRAESPWTDVMEASAREEAGGAVPFEEEIRRFAASDEIVEPVGF